MPYPNEHSARVRNPGDFTRFRSKEIADGIRIILGKLKNKNAWDTQAYRFDVAKFTAAEAKQWLKEHDVKYISFEAAVENKKINEGIRKAAGK